MKFTQMPNFILDKLLPHLTGSELKVLLVIVRKTMGWQKNSEKISFSTFNKMTGCGRGRASLAIKSLEDKRLISVDRSGNVNRYAVSEMDISESKLYSDRKQSVSESDTECIQNGYKSGSESDTHKIKKENPLKYTSKKKERTFEKFWEMYDKPVDAEDVEQLWYELSEEDKKNAVEFVPKYKASHPDRQYRKDPVNFLKGRTWETHAYILSETNGQSRDDPDLEAVHISLTPAESKGLSELQRKYEKGMCQ